MDTQSNQLFIDGISGLSYSAGAFRFNLASLQPHDTDSGKNTLEKHARVVMTPQSFIQTVKAMEAFLKQVEEKGVIRIGKPEEEQTIEAQES